MGTLPLTAGDTQRTQRRLRWKPPGACMHACTASPVRAWVGERLAQEQRTRVACSSSTTRRAPTCCAQGRHPTLYSADLSKSTPSSFTMAAWLVELRAMRLEAAKAHGWVGA